MSHPSPLAAAQHRALALRATGDLRAARQLLAEAVGSAPPPYAEDHPEMLHTAHLLARLHREADDPLTARRVLEEAFAAGERRWEHSDPVMLALAFELAEVAEELGNRHEARRNYTRVATAGPSTLGEHHPAVRAARAYLGPSASVPTEQHGPVPGPDPVDPPTESGIRSALSGPTLSMATLAAMRPSADSPAPTNSPWAPPPPATPRATPAGVRGPTTEAPAPVPRRTPAPPPSQPTRPSPPPAAPAVAPRQRADEHPPGSARPTVDQPSRPVPEGQPLRSDAARPPTQPSAQTPPPRPRAESQPPPSGQRPPQRPVSGPAAPPRQRAGEQASHPPVEVPPPPGIPPTPVPAVSGAPAPPWDNPTIQVRQIEPLLAEEAARAAAGPAEATGPVNASGMDTRSSGRPSPAAGQPGPTHPVSGPPAHPVSGPPAAAPAVAPPPAHPHPASVPPPHPSPTSAPPAHTYPVSAPPGHAYPVSAPPGFGHPVSAPPVSGPPVPPWGMTAPPWSHNAPPQPLPSPGTESAEASPTDEDDGDVDGGFGLVGGAAAVLPAQRSQPTMSDQTEVIPAVPPDSDQSRDHAPSVAQSSVVVPSTEPTPATWPADAGTDLAGAHPTAPRSVPPQHPDQYPTHDPYPTHDQYPPRQHQPVQVPYPGQQYHPAYDGYRPSYPDESGSAGRNRATLIGAAVAAGVAVVAVAGLGAVVLTRDDPPPAGSAPTATAQAPVGPPPGDLKLRDDATTITLTWTDPSGGAVPFMVAAGRAGQPLGVMATVDPGKTSYTVNGLNSRVDHCFTVLAVYSTDSFATSGQVCTTRERAPSSGGSSVRPSPS